MYSEFTEIAFLQCHRRLTVPERLLCLNVHKNKVIDGYKLYFSTFQIISILFCCKSISLIFAVLELWILNLAWMNYKQVLCFSTDAFEVSGKKNNPLFTKPGGNVAFTCPYKTEDSVQQGMWERIKADWVDIVILCNSSGKQSFGSDFKECTPVDCSDQENSKIFS